MSDATAQPEFVVAIPARHAASRLPGKPLRLIGDAPMVLHVAQRALAAGAREVWVATDDARIAAALADTTDVRVAMTAEDHLSGTDRLAECAQIAGWQDDTVVVNLQGDEPFAPPSGIRAVAQALITSGAAMATLATPVDSAEQVFDPNTVKVVRAASGDALYFSRAPLPWARDAFAQPTHALDARLPSLPSLPLPGPWLRHIGIYAYRAEFLRTFTALAAGTLERIESLEQLRVLEAGYRIAVALTPAVFPPGVDTEDDLERARAHHARSAGGAGQPRAQRHGAGAPRASSQPSGRHG